MDIRYRASGRLVLMSGALTLMLLAVVLLLHAGQASAQEAETPDTRLRLAIAEDAAAREQVNLSTISLLRADPVTWRDSCLGVGQPHESCALVLTPGFAVWVQAGDVALRYHTGLTAQDVRFAAGNLDPAAVPAAPLPDGTIRPGEEEPSLTYAVRAGDTLSRIAAQFGTTVAAIAAANDIANVNRIEVGQVLTIPGNGAPPPPPPPPPPKPAPGATYTVRTGDTLSRIAARFGTQVHVIAHANQIRNVHVIHVGQVLTIPGAPGPATKAPHGHDAERTSYVIRPGDTLGHIAARFGTTVHALAAANRIVNPHHIAAGALLRIP